MSNVVDPNNVTATSDFSLLDKVTGFTNDIVDNEHPAVALAITQQKIEDSVEDLNICFSRADTLAETVGIELTPNPNTDLEEMVAALATSNTDVSVESLSSLEELAGKFWQGLFQRLNSSWDNVFEYMLKSESKVIYLLSRVQQAESEIDRREAGTSKVANIDMGKSATHLVWHNQMPAPRELRLLIDKVTRDASLLLTERTALTIEYLHRILGSLESILESNDIEHVRNDLRNVARFGYEVQKQSNNLKSKLGSHGSSEEASTGRIVTVLGQYLGGRSVVMYNRRVNEADVLGDGRTLMKIIDDVFSTDIVVVNTETREQNTEYRTLSLAESAQLLESAHGLLKEVERFNQRFQDEVSELRSNFRRLRHDLSKAGSSADLREFNLYVRKAAYAAQRSTQWMFNPYVPLTTFILHVAHSAIILAETSINTHKLK
jgi:hypothetical protein